MRLGTLGVAVGFGFLVGVAACGSDYASTEPRSGAGQAGETGDGAHNQADGDGGAADAGPAGDDSSDGAGDAAAGEGGGGVGGNDAAAPDVVGEDCNGEPYTLDPARTRLCMLLASCAGPNFGPIPDNRGGDLDVSSCLRQGPAFTVFQFYQPPQALPFQFDARVSACAESIATCDDVLACAGYRLPITECNNQTEARCEGELAVNCGSDPSVTDCRRTTGTTGACKVIGSGAGQRAVCVMKETCAEAAGTFVCDGNTLYRCSEEGVGEGTDCSQFGLTCRADGEFGACVEPPPTATCDVPGKAECVGNSQTFCSADGLLYAHVCGPGQLVCATGTGDQPTDGVWLDCVPPGCPSLFDQSQACDGDDLITDFGLRLHCPDYGFATCGQGDSFVRCVN